MQEVFISRLNATNNYGGDDAMIVSQTDSELTITDSYFTKNHASGRGGTMLADTIASKIHVKNSTFVMNNAF